MLVNLRTIHKPKTYEEAAELLKRPGVYPLYGGGASLIRMDRQDIEEAVDLSELAGNKIEFGNNDPEMAHLLYIDCGATLQAIAEFNEPMASIIRADFPETLRNGLTLGDFLMEGNANSLFMALLHGLGANPCPTGRNEGFISMYQWFEVTEEFRRQSLITSLCIPAYYQYLNYPIRVACEKVSRTPSDSPIVGAIGFAELTYDDPQKGIFLDKHAIVTGLTDRPVRYVEGMQSQISDYKGSAEYRTEMAKILSKRAIAKATELAKM